MSTTDLVRQEPQTTALARAQEEEGYAALAHVLGTGDLAQLTNEQRVGHYLRLCRSLGLNELSRPFDWIFFKEREGDPPKLALYPNQSCAAQLRRQHHLRVEITRREIVGELFVCEARATAPDGRTDTASKYVPLTNKFGQLKGTMLANAMMKAETGAKRRVTFSMIGMASPPDADETAAWREAVIDGTGRIIDRPNDEQKALAADPRMARAVGEPVFEDLPVEDGGAVSQAARPDELERPQQSGPRPSFKTDPEQLARWRAAWFAIVEDTPWDNAANRAKFVAAFTADWPREKRTDSLGTLLARCTESEARDFLAQIEARVSAWKSAADGDDEDEEPAARPAGVDEKVHAAAVLTGAPVRQKASPEAIAALRGIVAEMEQAGARVDLPDLDTLDSDTVATLTADYRQALDGLQAAAF